MTQLNSKGVAYRRFQQNPGLASFQMIWDVQEKMPQIIEALFEKMRATLSQDARLKMDEEIKLFSANNLERLRNALQKIAADMQKGDAGYTPVKGHDYFTYEEVRAFIADIERNIRVPEDGKDADEEEIVKRVLNGVPKYNIQDIAKVAATIALASIPEPEQIDIAKEMDSLPEESIKISAIKGLEQTFEGIRNAIRKVSSQKSKQAAGGGDVVVAGTGITITRTPSGKRQISAAGSAMTIYQDTVSGVIDGVNKIFTVSNAISAPIFLTLANSSYQVTVDYTVSGTTITFVTAPDISLVDQPFWLVHT